MSSEERSIKRRDFIRLAGLGSLSAASLGFGVWMKSRSHRPVEALAEGQLQRIVIPPDPNIPELVVIQGSDPGQMVRKALSELGGIARFISPGDNVIIKPNIAWDRAPEQAANTNPQVVSEVVRLCREANAKRVVVTDISCNDPRRCYQRSGVAEAAQTAGAKVIMPDKKKFKDTNLNGEMLSVWPVFEPFLQADKIINIPIAKHHSLTGVTLGMKNWYGIIGGKRSQLHQFIHESIADLASFVRPNLTILDAFRVLIRNGPTGGNLADVVQKNMLIAGTNPVAVDAYAAKEFWDLDFYRLRYLQLAQERGLGQADFNLVRKKTVTI